MCCKQIGEVCQFGVCGKLSVNDQKSSLDKARLLRQLLDWNAAVAKDALLSVDKRNGAPTGTCVPVAAVESDQTGLIAQFANVDRTLTGRSFNQGQHCFFAVPV